MFLHSPRVIPGMALLARLPDHIPDRGRQTMLDGYKWNMEHGTRIVPFALCESCPYKGSIFAAVGLDGTTFFQNITHIKRDRRGYRLYGRRNRALDKTNGDSAEKMGYDKSNNFERLLFLFLLPVSCSFPLFPRRLNDKKQV